MQSVRSFSQVFGLVVFLLILTASPALAERVVLDDVPYIHQVLDMNTSKFYGHNACGPTSAVMLLKTHHLQPEDFSQYPGHYVYSPYVGFTDKEGRDYDGYGAYEDFAMDMTVNETHIHSVPGAHGAIVSLNSSNGNWEASWFAIKNHLKRHGLTVSEDRITADRFQVIKVNINSGLPLLGHTYITRNGATYGHFLNIVGYDTGPNGNQQTVIVNDPYGNACATWNGSAWGEEITYPLNGSCNGNTVNIDYVLTVHPVGIFSQFPGWYTAQNSSFNFAVSQKVLDVYNKFSVLLGPPHDNGGAIYIHELPNEPWNDPIYGQDFQNGMIVINNNLQKAFVLRGGFVWLYRGGTWQNPGSSETMQIWGPDDLGAPTSNEVFEYFTNEFGEQVVIRQYFQRGRLTYLTNLQSSAYGVINIEFLPNLILPSDAIEVPPQTDDGYTYESGSDIPSDLSGFGGGGGGEDPDPDPTAEEIEPPGIPQNISVQTPIYYAVDVGWQLIPEAESYLVFYQIQQTGEIFTASREGTYSNYLLIRDAKPKKTYCFQVASCANGVCSNFSNAKCATTPANPDAVCVPPENIQVNFQTADQITVSWSSATNAIDYTIDIWQKEGSMLTRDFTEQTAFSYTHNFTPEQTCQVKIQTYCDGELSEWSSWTEFTAPRQDLDTPTPEITDASPAGISLKWKEIPGAIYYQIYRQGDFFVSTDYLGWSDTAPEASGETCYQVRATGKNSLGENIASSLCEPVCAPANSPAPYEIVQTKFFGYNGARQYYDLTENISCASGGTVRLNVTLQQVKTDLRARWEWEMLRENEDFWNPFISREKTVAQPTSLASQVYFRDYWWLDELCRFNRGPWRISLYINGELAYRQEFTVY